MINILAKECDFETLRLQMQISQNEKKTVLRKVFTMRKVNKYSLLREKVL